MSRFGGIRGSGLCRWSGWESCGLVLFLRLFAVLEVIVFHRGRGEFSNKLRCSLIVPLGCKKARSNRPVVHADVYWITCQRSSQSICSDPAVCHFFGGKHAAWKLS